MLRADSAKEGHELSGGPKGVVVRQSVATRVIRANKSFQCMVALLIVSAMLALFALGCAIVYTRPTKVVGDTLVSSDGKTPVVVGRQIGFSDLLSLPSWADAKAYDELTHATYHTPSLKPPVFTEGADRAPGSWSRASRW